jgi:hypothetical protein
MSMATVRLHPALVHVPLGLAFVLPLVAAGLAVGLGDRAGKAGGELVYARGGAAAYAVDAVRAKTPAFGSLAHRDRHHD